MDDALEQYTEEQNLERKENLFRPLVSDARTVLRRAMLNQNDEKLAVSVAQDVLDRAGETKKVEEKAVRNIIISDSHIQLLIETEKEVFGGPKEG